MLWEIANRTKCWKCGTPLVCAAAFSWNKNGTIGLRNGRDVTLAVLNPDLYNEIFSMTEEVLEFPVRKFAFETVRNTTRSVFEDIFYGVPGYRYLIHNPIGYRAMVKTFYFLASITGYSRAMKIKQTPGKYAITILRNPYQVDLMSASIVGAYEFLDGVPFECTWREIEKDAYLVSSVFSDMKPEASERLEIEAPVFSGTPVKVEKCRICGVPDIISNRLEWKLRTGIITDNRTGIRLAFFAPSTLRSVFRELAAELGDEVNEIIVQCMRGWTVRNIHYFTASLSLEGSRKVQMEAVLRNYLNELPDYGQGYCSSVQFSDSAIDVTIENPHEEYLIAGTLRGIYEGVMKEECSVTLDRVGSGVVSFSIR